MKLSSLKTSLRIDILIKDCLFISIIISYLLILLILAKTTLANNDPLSPWNLTTPSPFALASHQAFVYSNRLYLVGGGSLYSLSAVVSSIIQPDGSLASWTDELQIPKGLAWHSLAMRENNIYVLGGLETIPSPADPTSVNSVYLGKINQEGKIENWQTLTSLPKRLALGGSFIYNNYLYYVGGLIRTPGQSAELNENVYVADINSDGTIGSWSIAATLPEPRASFVLFLSKNKLLIGGGTTQSFAATNTIFYSEISDQGNISAWVNLPPLPELTYRPGSILTTNHFIIMGGHDGSQVKDSIYYSQIDSAGLPGQWNKSSISLPTPNVAFPLAGLNKFIYMTGGYSGSNYLSGTYKTTLMNEIIPSPALPPTPSPTPTPLAPVVIIPGMGASWNYEALIHNKPGLPDTDWKIAPFVKIYDGIISSLKTAGYEEGKNLFIYAYDWRKTLTETASNFADFISNTVLPGKPPETKVNLVGHSLGGLLARTYLQNAGLSQTDKLITLGSPHKGTAKVYPLWEGANFSDYSGWQGLLMRLYLRINRRNFENDVAVVQNLVPSLQNIWPTFNFIKDSYGNIKPNSTLSWSNNLLPGLDINLSTILPLTRTISGLIENSTAQFLKTVQPSKLDEINNRWKDGKPVGKEFANGDKSVLLESSQLNGAAENISLAGLDHGQIVSLEVGQNEILRILEATSSGVDINQPNLEGAIIAAVASPTTFEITNPNGVKFSSQDDLLIIDNPVNGNYQLKLTGTGNGEYRLFFGRINGADEAWEEKSGTVSPGQSSSFTFPVDLNTPSLGGKPLLSAWEKIRDLQQQVNNWKIDGGAKEYILDKLYHYQHYIIKLYNPHHKYSFGQFDAELVKIHFDIEKFVSRLSTKKLFRNIGADKIDNIRQILRLVEEDLEQERGDRFGN